MTLAWMLRVSLAVQAALGVLLALRLVPAPWSWAAAPLLALATPVVLTAAALAIELAVGSVVDPRAPRRGLGAVVALWLEETRVSLAVFGWRQPFRADFPEPPLSHDPQRPAALLVHGYVCNRAVWRPFLRRATADVQWATVNLEPVFADIDAYADRIAVAVERLCRATGRERVALVAHSMGGVAVRGYLRRHGSDRIERAITIASPHHGTVFGRLGLGRNARQMATGSRYLAALAVAETPELRARFVCVAAADDNLIVPRASALLSGAQQHVIDGVGHLTMLEDARVWTLIEAAVRTPPCTEAEAADRSSGATRSGRDAVQAPGA